MQYLYFDDSEKNYRSEVKSEKCTILGILVFC